MIRLDLSRTSGLAAAFLLAILVPHAAAADGAPFCVSRAPVFADRLLEVSGGGAIHGSDGAPTLVQSNEKIVLSGGSRLEGDAISGGEVKISGGSTVVGRIVEDDPTPVVPAPVDDLVALHEFHNDNHRVPRTGGGAQALDGTELEVKGGDSLVLRAGAYYFTELKFSGGSTLHVAGDVRIYMPGGKFDFSGGGLAAGPAGATLVVVMAGSGEVKTSGGSNFHGAVYAPNAKVEVSGDGNSWGSVVARQFKLTGGSELYPHDACTYGPPVIPPTEDGLLGADEPI